MTVDSQIPPQNQV